MGVGLDITFENIEPRPPLLRRSPPSCYELYCSQSLCPAVVSASFLRARGRPDDFLLFGYEARHDSASRRTDEAQKVGVRSGTGEMLQSRPPVHAALRQERIGRH